MGWAEIKKAINSNLSKSLDVLINEKIGNANPSVADETNVMNFLKKVDSKVGNISSEGVMYEGVIERDYLRYNTDSPTDAFYASRIEGDFVYLGTSNTVKKYHKDNVVHGSTELATTANIGYMPLGIFLDDEHLYVFTNVSGIRKYNKTTLVYVGNANTGQIYKGAVYHNGFLYAVSAYQVNKISCDTMTVVGTYTILPAGVVFGNGIGQDETHIFVSCNRLLIKISKDTMTFVANINTYSDSQQFSRLLIHNDVIYAYLYQSSTQNHVKAYDKNTLTELSTILTTSVSSSSFYLLAVYDSVLFITRKLGTAIDVIKVDTKSKKILFQHKPEEIAFTHHNNHIDNAVYENGDLYTFTGGRFVKFSEIYKLNGYRRV